MGFVPKKVGKMSRGGEGRFTLTLPGDIEAQVEVAREEDRRTKNAEIAYLLELGLGVRKKLVEQAKREVE